MAADFWLGVAQTTIGSAVGFVFGIFAFHHQQRRQSAKKVKGDWRAALDGLIAQQAQEGGTGDGMTPERVIYYSGTGDALIQLHLIVFFFASDGD